MSIIPKVGERRLWMVRTRIGILMQCQRMTLITAECGAVQMTGNHAARGFLVVEETRLMRMG
uniref:Uncharacterized protein n=1 Tax=Picea sitchensis TaxID=3332 RepID=A9NLF5_PICSI|nr:unknown [Picea sitchensis]